MNVKYINYSCLLKFKNIKLDLLSARTSDCIIEYCSRNEDFDTLNPLKNIPADIVACDNNRIQVFEHLLKYCLDISRNLELYCTTVSFYILNLYLDAFMSETYEICGKLRRHGHWCYRHEEIVEFFKTRECIGI